MGAAGLTAWRDLPVEARVARRRIVMWMLLAVAIGLAPLLSRLVN